MRWSVMNLITNFMKIGEMIQNLKWERRRERGNLVKDTFFFLKRETHVSKGRQSYIHLGLDWSII